MVKRTVIRTIEPAAVKATTAGVDIPFLFTFVCTSASASFSDGLWINE
jgi:hypothetical protein